MEERGWLDTVQVSLRDLLKSGRPDYPWPTIFGYAGGDIGQPVALATDMRIEDYEIPPDTTDLTKAAVKYYLHTDGAIHRDAVLLAHGVVNDVVDNGAQPRPRPTGTTTAPNRTDGATIALMADLDRPRASGAIRR